MGAPFFAHLVTYRTRIIFCAATGVVSFLLTAMAGSLELKLIGVCFASVSSGFGEVSFLALSSFYHELSVSAWSSGTGTRPHPPVLAHGAATAAGQAARASRARDGTSCSRPRWA